jgi:hypothetical protein
MEATGQLQTLATFPLEERVVDTNWIQGCVTPEQMWMLWSIGKSFALNRSLFPAIQHASHRYKDWTTPFPKRYSDTLDTNRDRGLAVSKEPMCYVRAENEIHYPKTKRKHMNNKYKISRIIVIKIIMTKVIDNRSGQFMDLTWYGHDLKSRLRHEYLRYVHLLLWCSRRVHISYWLLCHPRIHKHF